MDATLTRKVERRVEALKKALRHLPEYHRLLVILPPNHNLSLSIEEESTLQKLTENVTYEGLAADKGLNSYLVQICGQSYFKSQMEPAEIARQMQEIYTQERENPTLKGCDWKGYSFDLRVCLRIASLFGATDEVFPHMRDEAIGVFILDDEE